MANRARTLRLQLNRTIIELLPSIAAEVDGYEVILENTTKSLNDYKSICCGVPTSLHSVNIFPTEPVSEQSLLELRRVMDSLECDYFSVHLCKGSLAGRPTGRLIPIVYSERMIDAVCRGLDAISRYVDQRILIENVAEYFHHPESKYTAFEFMYRVADQVDCGFLLDLNNALVNRKNAAGSWAGFENLVNSGRVAEIHVAGHLTYRQISIDSHDRAVSDECLDLLDVVLVDSPQQVAVVLERDSNFTADEIDDELRRIRRRLVP